MRYYEYDRETHVFVVFEECEDGDVAIDICNDLDELNEKYPDAISYEFMLFIKEMEVMYGEKQQLEKS